jgi:hypothetical protein
MATTNTTTRKGETMKTSKTQNNPPACNCHSGMCQVCRDWVCIVCEEHSTGHHGYDSNGDGICKDCYRAGLVMGMNVRI